MTDIPIPPADRDAEMSTLGSMLLDAAVIEPVSIVLPDSDAFYDIEHRIIYQALLALHNRNKPIDIIVVQDYLRRHHVLEKIGGWEYLLTLSESSPSPVNAVFYAEVVAEKAVRRKAIHAARNLEDAAACGNGQLRAALDECAAIAESGGVRPMESTSLADLMAEPGDDIAWLIEDLLPSGGLSMLASKPKVGKSTLARCMALAVARSERFLGHACQGGPVLYLGLEDKRAATADHFRRLGAAHEPVHIITNRPADGLPVNAVKAEIERLGAVLCIVDTLARMIDIEDLNDYAQVQRSVGPLLDLSRRTNCHVALLHHTGKSDRPDGDSILGSTALFGIVDVVATMKRNADGQRTLATVARYGADIEPTIIAMNPDTGAVSNTGTVASQQDTEIEAAILDSLAESATALTRIQLQKAIGGRRGPVYEALSELTRQGKIERLGNGQKTNPYRFRILFPASALSDETLARMTRE